MRYPEAVALGKALSGPSAEIAAGNTRYAASYPSSIAPRIDRTHDLLSDRSRLRSLRLSTAIARSRDRLLTPQLPNQGNLRSTVRTVQPSRAAISASVKAASSATAKSLLPRLIRASASIRIARRSQGL